MFLKTSRYLYQWHFLHFICVNENVELMLICKSRQTLTIVSFCDACSEKKTEKRYKIQTFNGANMRKHKHMHMHWNWNQFIVGCVLLNFNQKRKSNSIIQKQKLCRVRDRYWAVFFWIWKRTYYYVFMRKKNIGWLRINDWNCTHFTMYNYFVVTENDQHMIVVLNHCDHFETTQGHQWIQLHIKRWVFSIQAMTSKFVFAWTIDIFFFLSYDFLQQQNMFPLFLHSPRVKRKVLQSVEKQCSKLNFYLVWDWANMSYMLLKNAIDYLFEIAIERNSHRKPN